MKLGDAHFSTVFIAMLLFFFSFVTGLADLPVNTSIYEYAVFRFGSLVLGLCSITILILKWRKFGYFDRGFSCLLFILNVLNIGNMLLNLSTDYAYAIH